MREFSVPEAFPVPPEANLTDTILTAVRETPDAVVFARRRGAQWVDVTAVQFADQVHRLAAGLIAAGVRPADRVGLMCRTRFEWTLVDYAIWTAGAVTVPVYETSSAEQVSWILADSGAVAVVVETAAHRAVVESVAGDTGQLRSIWQIDGGGLDQLAEGAGGADPAEVERRRSGTRSDTLATIIYTSGTTGRPKGCELTHGNMLSVAMNASAPMPEIFTSSGSTLLFIPLAHVFARLVQVGCLQRRVRLAHSPDMKALADDLASFRPTFILSVPRVFEKVHTAARTRAHAEGKGAVFDLAERVAVRYSESLDQGRPGPGLRLAHGLFDRLVYRKLRAALGGRMPHAVSGGAPLGARLGHFFRGIGVVVLEGYGLTETAAGGTLSNPDVLRIGTVGRPLPGISLRTAEDGEIMLRGGNVFRGYWQNPAATAEAFDGDGWFHTGDLGEIDEDGFLQITGRKKEIIVTAGGKNVAPSLLEDRLRAHPLVSQCIVVGDRRPFIGCLITLDTDALPAWLAGHGRPESLTPAQARDDRGVQAAIGEAVKAANATVSRAEGIRQFRVLATDFTEEGGQLTPTLKLKRSVVLKEFDAEIESMYRE